MQEISGIDIRRRIETENPWWSGEHTIPITHQGMKRRGYFDLFFPLLKQRDIRRALVMMGPRRVGKTVLIHHAIQALIDEGVPPAFVCYISVDNPIYNGLSLEKLLEYYAESTGANLKIDPLYVFFDEIQYMRQWEVHLKSAVDTYPNIKFTASGSAAAALRLKSEESGAGRFTDFLLPPLAFFEYLDLLDKGRLLQPPISTEGINFFTTDSIEALNEQFLDYLNFGGYPEVLLSPQIQEDPGRFIKSDIIDKVLLRDLPSLYGITDIQELNYLFTTLAFNTGGEISLGELAQNSGVAKNTIKRYIEYLEAAFLIKIVHRLDHNAKRFKRANFFKVYLTNPSMRAALFSPLETNSDKVPFLAETAIFVQWFHSTTDMFYAKWQEGEVDIVNLNANQKVSWICEVKWSDRHCDNYSELKTYVEFCASNKLKQMMITSRTKTLNCEVCGVSVHMVPASIYCYTVGYNIVYNKKRAMPVPAEATTLKIPVKKPIISPPRGEPEAT